MKNVIVDGFYWIRVLGSPNELTIGQYVSERKLESIIESTDCPWEIIGSDSIYRDDQVEVVYGPLEIPLTPGQQKLIDDAIIEVATKRLKPINEDTNWEVIKERILERLDDEDINGK